METIKIDNDVPAPAAQALGRPRKWPFEEMVVGESFFVASDLPKKTRAARVNVVRAAHSYAKRHPHLKFVSRCTTKDGVEGVRVWRVGASK